MPKTSGLAIAAFVTGILTVFMPVFGIIPLILGILALRQIKNSPTLEGRSFAIIAIVTGILGIILTLLVIFALVYIGMFNPIQFDYNSSQKINTKNINGTCHLEYPFLCYDITINSFGVPDEDSVDIHFKNLAEADIDIKNVTLNSANSKRKCGFYPRFEFPAGLEMRRTIAYRCENLNIGKGTNRYEMEITYSFDTDAATEHLSKGYALFGTD